jgi:hypothetical protein
MDVVHSLPYRRNLYTVLSKPPGAGRRGYQYAFGFSGRAGFDMTLLWREEDTLDAALGRLRAIQPDPLAGRAPRDSMLPEFRGNRGPDSPPLLHRTMRCSR